MQDIVGRKIRITSMQDPYADRYIGKEGIITNVSVDPWGDTRLDGTWGGVALYPSVDNYEFVD